MSLDIFFLEDVRNALRAANEASSSTAKAATSANVQTLDWIAALLLNELPEGSRVLLHALHAAAAGNVDALKHYRRGYQAALTTVALAFGIAPQALALRQVQDKSPPQPPETQLTVPAEWTE